MHVDGSVLDVEVSHSELDLPGRREIHLTANCTQGKSSAAKAPWRRERTAHNKVA
jgi:hypothetical protein